MSESSPFAEYFLWHVGPSNFWRGLNLVPYIVGAVLSGSHAGPEPVVFYVLQFVQWFLIGLVLSIIFTKVFRRT